MSILEKHIKPRIRKELSNDLLIYNPNAEEKQKISKKLEEFAKLKTNENGLFLDTNFDEIEVFKFLVETLTNDNVNDLQNEKILEMLENGDEIIQALCKEFKIIIKETMQNYIERLTDQLDAICELFKQEETFTKLDEVLKSKNLNMQDLILLSQKENELKELSKNKVTPRDHLSKKRGRPKKADKVVKDTEGVKESDVNANS